MQSARRSFRLLPIVVLALGTTACGISIPTDPNGTLERVTGGELRVGVSENPPWTTLDSGDVGGLDADLVREFASSVDAEIEWEAAGEEVLMGRLERGELDLVIGGLTERSPWIEKAVLTKPFVEAPGEGGVREKHVLAAPLGENDFLVELESFLLTADVSAP